MWPWSPDKTSDIAQMRENYPEWSERRVEMTVLWLKCQKEKPHRSQEVIRMAGKTLEGAELAIDNILEYLADNAKNGNDLPVNFHGNTDSLLDVLHYRLMHTLKKQGQLSFEERQQLEARAREWHYLR